MIAVSLFCLAGVLAIQQFTILPNTLWLCLMSVLMLLLLRLRYWRLGCLMFGLIWACGFATLRLNDRLPASLESIEIPVTGRIISLPDTDNRRVSFDFATETPKNLPSKLRLSWYEGKEGLKAGQVWSFTVKLKRPHGALNPNGFDYEKLLFSQGIGAVGYVRPHPKPQLLNAASTDVHIALWRQAIADALARHLPDSANLALIKALTIGDGSAISSEDWEVFRKTGTTHLIVISGSHVGLIAGLVYFLLLKTWAWTGILRYSPPKVAALVALLIGVFYSALAGFSTPTQRAAVMLSVAMLAILSQRNTRPLHTLAAALLAVLLYDPFAVLSAGFWLSFLAVALIIYTVAGRLGKLNIVWETIKLNGVMSLGLAPLTLLFFQQVTLIAPIANLIAVPVISFLIVPFALLAVLLLDWIPILADALLGLADVCLDSLMKFLRYLAALPFAIIHHAQPPFWTFILASCGILILLAPRGLPSRYLGVVLLVPLMFSSSSRPAYGDLTLTLLDVGQGLAIAIQTAEHDLVYDTGAKFSDTSDQGKNVVLPFLHQLGVNQLDMLIISHGDNDHIGGAKSVLQGITVKKLLTSAPKQLSDYSLELCQAGQTWTWDGVVFQVLSPSEFGQSDNDNSCVLQLKTPHGHLLLTGDIEANAEQHLVQRYGKQLHSKILIAPHHGSHTSSTSEFLQAVQAETILISAGYRNAFHHPHADVLARYQAQHSQYLNSADQGAIVIKLENGVWHSETTRQNAAHYWNFQP